MQARSQTILETVIQDYINTGKPVSSDQLCESHDFGVKSATIRAELSRLIDSGFLMQPHTSSGRVPTDKGYKFFVAKVLADLDDGSVKIKASLKDAFGDAVGKLVEDVASELSLLGVGYGTDEGNLHKDGLDELFMNLDLLDRQDVFEIIRDFEMLDERIENILNHISGQVPSVFIGKSPITKSRHLSVVADVYDRGDEEIVLLAIGPKRMDYNKTIKTFRLLHQYE
ncbi:MAG: hypothetical protein Q8O87_01830 [bacterium]|nr:hypothetical protein [bacterium]